jgi:pimeloyl-ACP methyl ester carboxylesterase
VPTAFEKIIYVGHSYGSIIGNALNSAYPNDADATILTGFSNFFKTIAPSVLALALPLPAELVQPSRYGNLNDPGYWEFTGQSYFDYLFYYPGGYDTNFANYDWSTRGTITIGELITVLFGGVTADDYSNPVMVASGEYDSVFCNNLGLDLTPLLQPNCMQVPLINLLNGRNYLQGAQEYYPNVPDSDFEWYAVPNAGHCWQFHYSAYAAFGVMHNWMASNGF